MEFNLNEEVIDGHLVTSDMKKVWAVEMDIAKEIIRVCKKNNLRIWAEGGTLLGAVRHKGFIPWDDDMDFVIMREDYEKLKKIGPTEFKYPYFFQSFDTDNFVGTHVKIHRDDTAMIDTNYKERKMKHYGVFVDIIVMDGVPGDKIEFQNLYNKVCRTIRLLNRYQTCLPDYSNIRAILRTLFLKTYFSFNDSRKVRKNLIDLLSKNSIKESKQCAKIEIEALLCVPFDKISVRDCTWFDETIELPFHDMLLPAPKEYDKVLTSQFSKNYMTPLKVPNGHTIAAYDFNRSFVEVIKELDLHNK